ncbi:MAG TPA: hypothetical protein VGR46_05565 [Candidatus Limnocylindria bacterium]|jgi:hypothetical protein|nr:hypothetical protein [Candidatus Limnocylindria bacterium]
MTQTIRALLLIEAASFATAALVHFGVLTQGYEHRQAGTAESVIAVVLLIGLALSWASRTSTRAVGLVAQTIALLGTLVGVFTIAIGVGPRTVPDVAYHAAIVVVLVGGLLATARAPTARSTQQA